MRGAAFQISPATTADDLAVVAELFAAYAASLDVDLGYQDFHSEVADMPGKYAPPAGCLLLARSESGEPLGCAGLRPIAPAGCCEMKRLYVAPASRGLGLGKALMEAILGEARRIGYREMRLDTLPAMTAAQAMYREAGFRPIDPYYDGDPGDPVSRPAARPRKHRRFTCSRLAPPKPRFPMAEALLDRGATRGAG